MMRTPTVCVFEDEQWQSFLPLTYTRPVFGLRCGILTLFDKIAIRYSGCSLRHVCRAYLAQTAEFNGRSTHAEGPLLRARPEERVLFLNGRLLPHDLCSEHIPPDGPDTLYVADGILVGARLSGARLLVALRWLAEQDSQSVLSSMAGEMPVVHVQARLAEYPWDLIHANGEQIGADFSVLGHRGHAGAVDAGAVLYDPAEVYVGPGASVEAMAVLDARSGPIYIEDGARVQPFSYVQGPCYIGADAQVVSGRIREYTSIGPHCRVGGEVEGCIFHAYSNKYHDGFLGHSYVGEWVNIGALTTTSDLKNTYGTIRVDVGGRQIDTGHMKMGSIIGDHVKLGIGVLLNSGTSIGIGCNLYGGGMQPKVVPCFVWGGDGQYQEYDFERMLRTAQKAMGRRHVEQTEAYADLLRFVFDVTAPQRRGGV